MLKRLLSVAMCGLLLATTAIATPAMAAGSAPIDISAPLDGFSYKELKATYTGSSPFEKGGFSAPAGTVNEDFITAKVIEDDGVGDYIHIVPTLEAYSSADTVTAGAWLSDSSLNIGSGSGKNSRFTANFKFRYKTTQRNIFFYLVDENGGNYYSLFKLWTSDRLDIANGGKDSYGNSQVYLSDNAWYELTFSGDVSAGKLRVTVDGGNHDNRTVYFTCNPASSSVTYTGIRLGWNSTLQNGDEYLDVADMSVSNTGAVAYDEKLTFENGNLKTSNTGWASGPWTRGASGNISYWAPTAVDMGGLHGKAIKLSHDADDGQDRNHFWFVHTVPAGAVSSDGVFVAEGSYYEDDYSQFCIELQGTNTSKIYPLSYVNSSEWKIKCLGDTKDDTNADMEMPKRMGWVRIRVICDLATDKLTLQYWQESNPSATLVTATRANALTGFTDITKLWFKVYNKDTNADSDTNALQYVDDFRVYVVDSLQRTNSTPADNTRSRVALDVKPMMEFNMPIADSAISDMVTLEDSKGNAIDGTASLSPCGYGIMFTPDSILSPDDTYTYTIDGTLTDIFGQTLAIDKSISFSTSPSIKLKDCTFKQGDTIVTQNSELTCDSAISATVELAPNYGSVPVTLLLGLYDADTDIMVDAKAVYIASLTDTTQTLTLDKPMVAGFDYYPAVFVWSGVETAVPYMEYISLK